MVGCVTRGCDCGCTAVAESASCRFLLAAMSAAAPPRATRTHHNNSSSCCESTSSAAAAAAAAAACASAECGAALADSAGRRPDVLPAADACSAAGLGAKHVDARSSDGPSGLSSRSAPSAAAHAAPEPAAAAPIFLAPEAAGCAPTHAALPPAGTSASAPAAAVSNVADFADTANPSEPRSSTTATAASSTTTSSSSSSSSASYPLKDGDCGLPLVGGAAAFAAAACPPPAPAPRQLSSLSSSSAASSRCASPSPDDRRYSISSASSGASAPATAVAFSSSDAPCCSCCSEPPLETSSWSAKFALASTLISSRISSFFASLAGRAPELEILNPPAPSPLPSDPTSLAADIRRQCLNLEATFVRHDGRGINYGQLRESAEFAAYVETTARLRNVSLRSLSESAKKAFFLNIYNALTIHAIAVSAPHATSVLEIPRFWTRYAYIIDGTPFTLDTIEHGILRGNRPHPSGKRALLAPSDAAFAHVLPLDPRIHFALVCGAKSCPAIRVYTEQTVERGLDMAARNFCSQNVEVKHRRAGGLRVVLSRIFQWYAADFAASDLELLRYILQFVDDRSTAASLRSAIGALASASFPVTLAYADYDWSLNKCMCGM